MANDSDLATTWLDVWERAAAAPAVARADALLSPTGPDVAALTLGERDARLLDLRARLFGARLRSMATCPACAERCEWDCDVDALRADAPATDGPIEIRRDDWRIRARPVTATDLAALADCADEAAAMRTLLRRCVLDASRDDRAIDAAELPDDCIERLSTALAAADPQAAMSVALVCPACAHAWPADFDIAAYLFAELDAWAQRTLFDVHELASRYHWSEREILALPPSRRARYLSMVAE